MSAPLNLPTRMPRWEPRAELALQLRIALIEVLAPDGRCACCRGRFAAEDLQIDHQAGVTWDRKRIPAWTRAERYWEERDAGVPMRALCISCNSRDGQRFRGRARYKTAAARRAA